MDELAPVARVFAWWSCVNIKLAGPHCLRSGVDHLVQIAVRFALTI